MGLTSGLVCAFLGPGDRGEMERVVDLYTSYSQEALRDETLPRRGAPHGGRPYAERKLGAEEDGFALEHFDGDEECRGGVDTGGREDDGDVVPVISADDQLLAEETDIEDGDEG